MSTSANIVVDGSLLTCCYHLYDSVSRKDSKTPAAGDITNRLKPENKIQKMYITAVYLNSFFFTIFTLARCYVMSDL